MGCLASVQCGKKMMIGNYTDTVRYTNLYYLKERFRMGGKEVLSVIKKEFQTFAVHMKNFVKEADGRRHQSWIVPALLNPMRFILKCWYFEGH